MQELIEEAFKKRICLGCSESEHSHLFNKLIYNSKISNVESAASAAKSKAFAWYHKWANQKFKGNKNKTELLMGNLSDTKSYSDKCITKNSSQIQDHSTLLDPDVPSVSWLFHG